MVCLEQTTCSADLDPLYVFVIPLLYMYTVYLDVCRVHVVVLDSMLFVIVCNTPPQL